jgi:xanthine dehydrogenase accessory factor
MTHSHPLDEAICERILRRDDFAYFGLIGSLAKRRQFEKRLEQRGTPPGRLAAMTCPIGIAGIPGKEPATIAIAVAAELLQAHARSAARSTSVPSSAQLA